MKIVKDEVLGRAERLLVLRILEGKDLDLILFNGFEGYLSRMP